MFDFSRRNKVAIPFGSVEEIRGAYAFSNLQDFLDIYYQGANVLQTEEDFRDLALAHSERVFTPMVVATLRFSSIPKHTPIAACRFP